MRPSLAPVRLAAAFSLLAAAAAGRAAEEPRCSLSHPQDWREYRSAHFVVSTDAGRAGAAELVRELEQQYALVVAALFGPDVEVPGVVRVVALASPGDFEAIAQENAAAYAARSGGRSIVVLPLVSWRRSSAPELIAHELAHDVSWHHFPRQPHWLSEGLATFVQSVANVRSDDAAPTGSHIASGGHEHGGHWAGYPSPEIALLVKQSLAVSAKDLLGWRGGPDDETGRLHAASWLLYGYLWNRRSKAFTDYEERLASGDAPAAAWRAAFPDLDPASPDAMRRLDDELAVYRRSGRFASYRVDAGAVDASFEDVPLPSADVHLLLLEVRARWPDAAAERRALARAAVDEALREDPAQPDALARRAEREGAPLADAVRPATVAHPDSARAWLLLGIALDPSSAGAAKEAALRKAVALAPRDAAANNDLAWLLVTTGRAREARPFAERALDLAPWDRGVVDTLAAVAFGLGQCRPALALERRAADLYGPDEKAGEGVRRRLAEYEARCAAPAAPAAGK